MAGGARDRGQAAGPSGLVGLTATKVCGGGALSSSRPDLGPAGGRLGVAGSRRCVERVVAVLCLLVRPRRLPDFLSEEGSDFLPGLEVPWS